MAVDNQRREVASKIAFWCKVGGGAGLPGARTPGVCGGVALQDGSVVYIAGTNSQTRFKP